jgi:preprotein translocase subunit YajC
MMDAYADTGVAAQAQGGGFSFFIMAIILLFAYFAIWRPQSKRVKAQQALLKGLAKGDEIMTAGGLLGRITKITDQYLAVAVASGVEIMLEKSSVVNVLPKGTLKSLES